MEKYIYNRKKKTKKNETYLEIIKIADRHNS